MGRGVPISYHVITGLVGWSRLARQHLRGRGSRTSVQNTGQLGVSTGRILGQREDDCARAGGVLFLDIPVRAST
jgi:hypothetical protein